MREVKPDEKICINHTQYSLPEAEAADLINVKRNDAGEVYWYEVKSSVLPVDMLQATTLADGTVVSQH